MNEQTPIFGALKKGETRIERSERHHENIVRFFKWARNNMCVIQVSYPRSGRQWMANILHTLTGKQSVMPHDVNCSKYEKVVVFTMHGFRYNYIRLLEENVGIKLIFLVRDPRDCALSSAYRALILDPTQKEMSSNVVKAHVEHTCKVWMQTVEIFYQRSDLVVQYEHLCLMPEKTIKQIMKFLEEKFEIPVQQAILQCDNVKSYEIVDPQTHIKGKNIRQYITRQEYKTDYSRYLSHCNHWKDDEFFLPEFNEMICDVAITTMEGFGYNYEGHDLTKWEEENF